MKKRIFCVIGLILFFGLLFRDSITSEAAVTNDSIKQKESEIAESKKERESLKNNLSNIEKMKKELESSKNNLEEYITQLDSDLADVQEKIQELIDMISKKQEDIEEATHNLEEAQAIQEAQYEAMKKRIRFMYESGDSLYLDMLLSAESFGDMLNKAEYVEMISAYDKKKLQEYVAIGQMVNLCKLELEEEKSVLEDAQKAQETEEENLNELIDEKSEQINQVEGEIKDKEAAIKEYEAEIASRNAEIAALERAVEEERRALEESNQIHFGGGPFTWPAPSYTKISDDYGNRIHPTLGIEKFHNGLDMAAPGGSPILAAASGKVVAADYSSSMGNYIMLSHGDGIYTIYMHASALYVSKGDSVSQGQKIAAVGTTGRSTGNHLHFSVRVNGNYVNPWGYL